MEAIAFKGFCLLGLFPKFDRVRLWSATTVTLANGVSLEVVSRMLSHTSLNTTKIYARLMDSRVIDEMKALKIKLDLKQIK